MPDDAKRRLRCRLKAHDYADGHLVPVPAEDLREALRELGELRQRTQQQHKAILTVGEDWRKKGMPMGRIFANAAASAYRLENAGLRLALGMNPEPDFGPIFAAWRQHHGLPDA